MWKKNPWVSHLKKQSTRNSQGQMPGVGDDIFLRLKMGIVHGCHGKMILSATNIFVLFDLPSGYD